MNLKADESSRRLGLSAAASEESHELQRLTPEEILTLPIDPGLRRMVGKWQVLRDGFRVQTQQ